MSTYEPQHGVHVGRPPCVHCAAAYRLHHDGPCPVPYRPETLTAAVRALREAKPGATFAARGDLQRLLGRGHEPDGCVGCEALA